jgi:hypothetical protein
MLFAISCLAILAVSGCATTGGAKSAKRLKAFASVTPPAESVGDAPRMEDGLPNFEAVDVNGRTVACLSGREDMTKQEKLEVFADASGKWSGECKTAFDASQERSRSFVQMGKATEEYANVLADQVDDSRKLLDQERSASKWSTTKHMSVEAILVIVIGLVIIL